MKKIYLLFATIFTLGVATSNAQCVADFQSFVNGSNVFFQDSSSYSPQVQIFHNWNFGDGSTGFGTNPSHSYTASGTYNVCLTIYDSLQLCYDTICKPVVITIPPANCNASYTVAKDSSTAFGVILYNTSSNLGSHLYTWDFGDGTTGSGRTPSHQYQSFGSYIVCLTVVDTFYNCTSTFCDTVGMDTLGNLKAGFGLSVQNPVITSINEVKDLNAVSVFPNPASSNISIDLSSVKEIIAIRVFDLTGKVVLERTNKVGGNVELLNISALTNGLYYITLDNGVSQATKKFIKQ